MKRITERHVDHIVALERQGRLTPEEVLEDARREDSPLHDLYDWDMTRAAERHWLDRTREIIRVGRVVVHTETQSYMLPRYTRDPDAAPGEQGYLSLDALRVDPGVARRALIAEFERVASALRRARTLAGGLDLEDQVASLLERVVGLQALAAAVQPEGGVEEPQEAVTAAGP